MYKFDCTPLPSIILMTEHPLILIKRPRLLPLLPIVTLDEYPPDIQPCDARPAHKVPQRNRQQALVKERAYPQRRAQQHTGHRYIHILDGMWKVRGCRDKKGQIQPQSLANAIVVLCSEEHAIRYQEPTCNCLDEDDVPLRVHDVDRNPFDRAALIRVLGEALGDVREHDSGEHRANEVAEICVEDPADVLHGVTPALQPAEGPPHRVPGVELRAREVDDDEADGEGGALEEALEARVVALQAGAAGRRDDGEDAGGADEEATEDVFDEGELEGLVQVVQARVVGCLGGFDGGEGAGGHLGGETESIVSLGRGSAMIRGCVDL